jgi:YQGE family putative transporter
MTQLRNRIKTEIAHLQRLHTQAKTLLLSITLYNLIAPILSTFTNAFLFRESHSFSTVAYYNIFLYLSIPLGFFLNGILLRRFTANMLYVVGLFLQTLTVSAIVFVAKTDAITLSIFGIVYGITIGIYWANRNLLTLKTTHTDNRIYFSSLESNSNTITDILMPIAIGWFITAGTPAHFYTATQAYRYLGVLSLLIVTAILFLMKNLTFPFTPPTTLRLKAPSSNWRKFRLLEFILGLVGGLAAFAPTLMVLSLIGKENTLGTIQSASAILTILMVYVLGKKLHVKHRLALFQIAFLLDFIGAGIFATTYSSLGVFTFFICQAFSTPFSWIAISSLNYDLVDKENGAEHYASICDQEIYLNLGRTTAIITFFVFTKILSNGFALRFTPILFVLTEIGLIILAKQIEKSHSSVV